MRFILFIFQIYMLPFLQGVQSGVHNPQNNPIYFISEYAQSFNSYSWVNVHINSKYSYTMYIDYCVY